MRSIGESSSLENHVLEMLLVGARLKAHPKAEIASLGEAVLKKHAELRQLWFESISFEEVLVIATANLQVRDLLRDKTLVELGSYLRTFAPHLSEQIFHRPPSELARLGYENESKEIQHLLARLDTFPADSPARLGYSDRLRQEEVSFQTAKATSDDLAAQRASLRLRILQAKIDADAFRFQRYADCLLHLSKSETETLFATRRSS